MRTTWADVLPKIRTQSEPDARFPGLPVATRDHTLTPTIEDQDVHARSTTALILLTLTATLAAAPQNDAGRAKVLELAKAGRIGDAISARQADRRRQDTRPRGTRRHCDRSGGRHGRQREIWKRACPRAAARS